MPADKIIIDYSTLLENDIGDGLSIATFAQPTNGGWIVNQPHLSQVVYNPPPDEIDSDVFAYTIRNSRGLTSTANVTVYPMYTADVPPKVSYVDRWRIRINASTGPESELASPPTICVVQSMNLFTTQDADGSFGMRLYYANGDGTTPSVDNLPLTEPYDASMYDFTPAYRFAGPAPWYLQANFPSYPLNAITVGRFGGSVDASDYYTVPGYVFNSGPKAGQLVPIYRTVRQFDVQHYDSDYDLWRTVYRSPTDTGTSSEAGAGQAWQMDTLWPNRINHPTQLSVPVKSYTLVVTAASDTGQCEIQRIEFRSNPGVAVSPIMGTASGTPSTNNAMAINVFELPGGTPYNMTTPDFGSRYLRYDALNAFVCTEVAITASANPQHMPKRFDIYATDPISGWSYVVHPIYTSQLNWAPGETRVFTFPAVTEPARLA